MLTETLEKTEKLLGACREPSQENVMMIHTKYGMGSRDGNDRANVLRYHWKGRPF